MIASRTQSGAGTLGLPRLKSYTLSAPYFARRRFPSSNIMRIAELFWTKGFIFSAIIIVPPLNSFIFIIPTDCSVLRTLTILPSIRISQDFIPLLCSYRGGSQVLTSTYEQAHVDSELLTLVSYFFLLCPKDIHPTRTSIATPMSIHGTR